MNQSNTDHAPAKSARRYRPRKKPIAADTPTNQPINDPQPIEKTPAMVEGLKPKTKIEDNKRSMPRNEPLEIPETLVLGLSGLSLRPGKLKYRVDASGYTDIIRKTYEEYNSLDRYFERHISPAMFEYYCTLAYWLRVYQILHDTGRDPHMVYDQLRGLTPSEYVLPTPVAAWLSGLGGFTDPSGRQFEIDFHEHALGVVYQGVHGGFGQVAAGNVQHYACNIAMFPIIYRLYAENCTSTQWVNNHHFYLLPGTMTAPQGGQPNENLLGWAPLVRPHEDVRRQLQRLHVSSHVADPADPFVQIDQAPSHIRGLPYIKGLAEYIAGKLSTSTSLRTVPTIPTNQIGSMTQVGWVETPVWEHNAEEPYPRTDKVTLESVTGFSAHQLSVKTGCAIPIMKYRLNRRSTAQNPRPEFFPYSFPVIPAAWHANINAYYHHGGQARWNIDDFDTTTVSGSLVTKEFVQKYRT